MPSRQPVAPSQTTMPLPMPTPAPSRARSDFDAVAANPAGGLRWFAPDSISSLQHVMSHSGSAVYEGDKRVADLCQEILDPDSPWRPQATLDELSANHLGGDVTCGDMLRFVTGSVSHIATKVLVQRGPDGFQVTPSALRRDGADFVPSSTTVEAAWSLVHDVLAASRGGTVPPFAVKIERLEYPDSGSDLARISQLLHDAGGPLSRVGHRLDAGRVEPRGHCDRRGARSLYAIATLQPHLHRLARRIDRPDPINDPPPGYDLLVGSHLDTGKILSLISGDRGALLTQSLLEGRFQDLPVASDRCAVIGGGDGPAFGIAATPHRVLLSSQQQRTTPNTTLVIAAVAARPR